jgi:hypothetical protein
MCPRQYEEVPVTYDSDDPSRERVIRNWKLTLNHMVKEHRHKYPDVTKHQTDQELMKSLVNYFISKGVVKRTADGRYLIPDLQGPSPAGFLERSRSRTG